VEPEKAYHERTQRWFLQAQACYCLKRPRALLQCAQMRRGSVYGMLLKARRMVVCSRVCAGERLAVGGQCAPRCAVTRRRGGERQEECCQAEGAADKGRAHLRAPPNAAVRGRSTAAVQVQRGRQQIPCGSVPPPCGKVANACSRHASMGIWCCRSARAVVREVCWQYVQCCRR